MFGAAGAVKCLCNAGTWTVAHHCLQRVTMQFVCAGTTASNNSTAPAPAPTTTHYGNASFPSVTAASPTPSPCLLP